MKYVCLGNLQPGKFENMSESKRNTVLDECFSYNDELRTNGVLVAEEPLQPPSTAMTAASFVFSRRLGCVPNLCLHETAQSVRKHWLFNEQHLR